MLQTIVKHFVLLIWSFVQVFDNRLTKQKVGEILFVTKMLEISNCDVPFFGYCFMPCVCVCSGDHEDHDDDDDIACQQWVPV